MKSKFRTRKSLKTQVSVWKVSFNSINKSKLIAEAEDHKKKVKSPLKRLIKLNSPEWIHLLVGVFSALVIGASFPCFAILFGNLYGLFGLSDETVILESVLIICILFIVLGCVLALATFFQSFALDTAGARLTKRLRQKSFATIMQQEVAWFDVPRNSVGELLGRLSSDCSAVQGAIGSPIGQFFQAVALIIVGTAIASSYSWKLTLASIWTVPLTLGIIFAEAKYMSSSEIKEKEIVESTTKLAVEVVANHKTVKSLGLESHLIQKYDAIVDEAMRTCLVKTRLRGVAYGLGKAFPILSYSVALCYGAYLVSNFELEFESIVK